jgi:FkbH-like protein
MLSDLSWLPKPKAGWLGRLDALKAEANSPDPGPAFGERAIALATHAFDEAELGMVARLAAAARARHAQVPGLMSAKIGLLGDGTQSLATPAISGSGLRHGLLLEVLESEYGSAVQEASDPGGKLRTAGLDFALVASDPRLLGLDGAARSAEAAELAVEGALARIRMIVEGIRPAIASAILVQTLVPPFEPLFGSLDRLEATSPFCMTEALNRKLAEWATTGAIVLVDIARLANSIGLERWHEPRHWHASKLAFEPEFLPVYGDLIARTVAAVRGRSRKCLVLDLDNTLWGGVIGDDGLDGIVLGQGSADGEAFVAIQSLALDLRARGVVLAVCSKNEDDVARRPFRDHPDMMLRESDIAVFQANWTDKAANLRAIAETLNIGIDALVLLDDNPAEREQVRRELPLVAVPEIPDDPAYYPRILAAAGYFEAVTFSQEDRDRAGYYQGNAERAAALTGSDDIEGYLASLEMVCSIGRIDAVTRARSAQLINKSNQYNLTTRRYSEAEVRRLETDPDLHAIQVRLVDRFGDNGIISIVIANKGAASWEIDTWLMSCRVLGRRVEHAVLSHLAEAARDAGAKTLIGRYIPSPKNKMVAEHYGKLGFVQSSVDEDGGTTWRLDLDTFVAARLPMKIEDSALRAFEPQL